MSTKENKELVRQLTKGRNEFAGEAAKVTFPGVRSIMHQVIIYHNLARGDLNQEQTIKVLCRTHVSNSGF